MYISVYGLFVGLLNAFPVCLFNMIVLSVCVFLMGETMYCLPEYVCGMSVSLDASSIYFVCVCIC